MNRHTMRRAALLAVLAVLAVAGTASAALLGLPSNGSQVNDDPAAGIDPAQDAGLSDAVGGSLVAGGGRVPWGTFEQKRGSAQLIFTRAFKDGRWTTQGGALNIDPTVEAEAPSIDFAGPGRTVPWDAWYEPNSHLSGGTPTQIFASRFSAATKTWIPEGQDRAPSSKVPSLNINTDRTAENPSVAGGTTVAGNAPTPWVTWEENDGGPSDSASHRQIFVSKGVPRPPAPASCGGVKPSANTSVGVFCWQQVGLDRLSRLTGASSGAGDPTLNVDPSRNGVEPDIAFTGPSDTVPWVVWYEKDSSGLGLRDNEQVFAAKAVADTGADGGFHWQAVGNGTAGQVNRLDTSGAHGFGACAASTSAEDACSLNRVATRDAEDPRVAAGTLTPGKPTVPWTVWAEQKGGNSRIFVSRLVGGDHFELFNGGNPVSAPGFDAAKPDITFFGNVPYVSWTENRGGRNRGFVGHFDPFSSQFLLDTPGGTRLVGGRRASLIDDARMPISSNCTADPFSGDGSACPVAQLNAPFDLFTTAGSPQRLFGQAVIGGLNCVIFRGCTLVVKAGANGGIIASRLGLRSKVGIIIDRVLRIRKVHGKRVVVARRIGRVPLGVHHKGRVRIRWNLKVNGRRLGPGRFRMTMRALDRKGRVLGLSRSTIIRIKKHPRKR
jgi:hypothetical protein